MTGGSMTGGTGMTGGSMTGGSGMTGGGSGTRSMAQEPAAGRLPGAMTG